MLAFISRRLGRRDLIWGGLRADDIEAISDLKQLAGSFAIVGGHDRGGAVPSLDYEDLAGMRPDLDNWDIEHHLGTVPTRRFREAMLRRLAEPTALLPYRSSAFLSAILFARRDRCLDLGLFGAHQAIFDHKPWVETMVAGRGIPHVEWSYVADEEMFRVRRMLAEGPVLLRLSRSSGGAGLVKIDHASQLAANWPRQAEAFASVTMFLEGALPVNVGATVWHDGVTMRHPSVQLIGIPNCTTKKFGYCGNDFGLAGELDVSVLNEIEVSVKSLGQLLRNYGYLGAFGVDFLVHRGVPLFSEINPRFQGSTHASSQLSSEAGESCLILDHIAAMLGHDAPPPHPLRETVSDIRAFAHLVVHWTRSPAVVDSTPLVAGFRRQAAHCRSDVLAKPSVVIATGGVVARFTVRDRMTGDGYDIVEPWASLLKNPVEQWLPEVRSTVRG